MTHEAATTPLNHYSFGRYLADLAGVQPPGEAAGSPSRAGAFTI